MRTRLDAAQLAARRLAEYVTTRVTRGVATALMMASSTVAGAQRTPIASSAPLSQWQHSFWTFGNEPFVVPAPAMLRSADGYLWIGADNKLLRFDGVRFSAFDSSNTPAFRNKDASRMVPVFLDSGGTLWIRGEHRALFTYRNGKFALATAPDVGPNARTRSYHTASTVRDGHGRIWWADRELVTIEGGHSKPPRLPPGVPDTTVVQMANDTGAGVWFGTTTDGLWHVSDNTVEHFPFEKDAILPVAQTSDGVVWAISRGRKTQLWRLVKGKWEGVHLYGDPTQPLDLQSVAEAPDHSIFLATRGYGVLRWQNGAIERFDESNGLSSNNTTALHIAPDGTVWVATEAGLDRLRQSEFLSVDRLVGMPFGPAFQFAPEATGGLWATTPGDGKLYLLDGGAIRQRGDRITSIVSSPTAGDAFSMLESANGGGIWIAPNTGGLVRYRKNGTFVVPRSAGLPAARFIFGVETRDGAVWLHAFSGEFGRLRNGVYKRIRLFGRDTAKISSMFEDDRGRLWASSSNSNEAAIVTGDSVTTTLTLPKEIGFVSWLAYEGHDTVWVSGRRSLYRIIGSTVREARATNLERFFGPSSHIEAGAGQLWIANRGGIARISLRALHDAVDRNAQAPAPTALSALDGIAKPYATSRIPDASDVFPDGRVWFATPGGYVVSNPFFHADTSIRPEPHAEEVFADGTLIPADTELKIPPTPDRVSIHYSATSLTVPERVHVEYMLEGADRTWVDGSATPRVATYTQLRPGSYRFRVRAWNVNSIPTEREAVLRFRVLPAWYQTYWFIAACTVLLAALGSVGALAVQRRRNRSQAERTEARFTAVLEERTRIARELHDTLLQGFTGITLHLETVRTQLAQRADASAGELTAILQHADGTLREARDMVWDIRSPELDGGLMHAIETESRKILNGDNVQLLLSVTGQERRLTPLVEATILRVAREAVTNARKHADPKCIAVTLAFETRRVTLTVRDDGSGAELSRLDEARSSGHWGMAGMRERASRAGGTFDIRTTPGQGLSVAITLPVERTS